MAIFVAALSGAIAAPADQDAGTVAAPAACLHGSYACSTHWAGLCEDYCRCHGGFSHMSGGGCSLFSKRCCCNR